MVPESAECCADAELLADAVLAAVEEELRLPERDESSTPDAMATAALVFRRLGIDFVCRYNRLELAVEHSMFDSPVLFVANHGFGGIFDLNVFAVAAVLEQLQLDRSVIVLTHQLAWTLRVGAFFEQLGARPASQENAREAFDAGHHVVVLPGGDLDAFKSWEDRNRVVFGGRTGFARLAMGRGVPIVPIVTAGAGESLLVLSSGERLARALRLDKLLRLKAFPASVSLPWGLDIGAVGLLPYLPLPSKLCTRVLPAVTAGPDEEPDAYAARVQSAMQDALTDMTKQRRPLLG
jgi:1-acyl-sn-glycerol-3-phosphate acyltransferase